MHGLNELRCLGIIAQRAAQLSNTKFEHTISHNCVGPNRIQQLIFGHQLSGMGQQMLEDGKRFGFEGDGVLILPQLRIFSIKTKWAKLALHSIFYFAHCMLTKDSLFSHDSCPASIL